MLLSERICLCPEGCTPTEDTNGGGDSKKLPEGKWGHRPANNKLCPCGSNRKYKACCKIRDAARLRRQQAREEMGAVEVEKEGKRLSMVFI